MASNNRSSRRRRRTFPEQVTADVHKALSACSNTLTALLEMAPPRGTPPPVQPQPEGSPVVPVQSLGAQRQAAVTSALASPFKAVGVRWRDAMREARLAARDKEVEVRAEYELRVQRDARRMTQQPRVRKP